MRVGNKSIIFIAASLFAQDFITLDIYAELYENKNYEIKARQNINIKALQDIEISNISLNDGECKITFDNSKYAAKYLASNEFYKSFNAKELVNILDAFLNNSNYSYEEKFELKPWQFISNKTSIQKYFNINEHYLSAKELFKNEFYKQHYDELMFNNYSIDNVARKIIAAFNINNSYYFYNKKILKPWENVANKEEILEKLNSNTFVKKSLLANSFINYKTNCNEIRKIKIYTNKGLVEIKNK